MSKFLGVFTILGIYISGITILIQSGYNAYFGIPSAFIESSLKENVLYFFQLFNLWKSVVVLITWWMWVIFIVAVLVIIFFYFSHYIIRKMIIFAGLALAILLLLASYNFGGSWAADRTNFYILPHGCLTVDQKETYLIPTLYDGKAVLVPFDENTRRLKDGFMVKDISELPCMIETKEVGRIEK